MFGNQSSAYGTIPCQVPQKFVSVYAYHPRLKLQPIIVVIEKIKFDRRGD